MPASLDKKQAKTSRNGVPKRDAVAHGMTAPEVNPHWQSLAIRPISIQPKMAVGSSDDAHEHEADQIADRVMRMPASQLQRACACGGSCRSCNEEANLQTKLTISSPADRFEQEADRVAEKVLTKSAHADVGTAPQRIHRYTAQATGQVNTAPANLDDILASTGSSLDPALREDMEQRFGRDFSGVRLHSGGAAEQSALDVNAHAYTVGQHMVFGAGRFAPGTHEGRRLIAHELTHVVQQTGAEGIRAGQSSDNRGVSGLVPLSTASGPVIQRQPAGANPPRVTTHPQRLELEIVGSDARIDEPLAVMANRWARAHGGKVLRVSSVENMIGQIAALVNGNTCLGKLIIWYHGAPEIQLLVGNYQLPPTDLRLPASGFTREWLQLDRNRAALNRFRSLFCCDGFMQWIGCGTATVRAPGGLRTPAELELEPALLQEHPDIYQSADEARAHGAKLAGGSFGAVNVQAWANATCTTIRSATNLVTLHPESKDLKSGITIDNHGRWTDVKAQGTCLCDAATGRVGGTAPTRAEMVKEAQKETAALIGKENVLWHHGVRALRTGLPHKTEVVGAGSQGERTFEIKPGTLPAALQKEIKHRDPAKRDPKCANMGPLECYYTNDVLRPLLHMAGAGVTPPAPLPNDPMPEAFRWVRIATGGTWAAVTQRNLAVVNRDDFWAWIVFTDRAIGETPAFTRTVIQHELEHAADYEKDLREFELTHPRPASIPPPQFGRPAEESTVRGFGGEWGKYINDFIAFSEGRTRPERHLEIILGQRRQEAVGGGRSWERWSAGERAYWFQLVFHNLPPDVARSSPLPGEDQVLEAFNSAGPDLQLAAIERGYKTIQSALCPDKTVEDLEIEKRRANARTLVQHFDVIMERILDEQMRNTPRSILLDLLRRPAKHPRGMECQL